MSQPQPLGAGKTQSSQRVCYGGPTGLGVTLDDLRPGGGKKLFFHCKNTSDLNS